MMCLCGSAWSASRWLCVGAAICLATGATLRAQGPVNPLRAGSGLPLRLDGEPTPARPPADIWTESAPAPVRPAWAEEPQPPEPPSVVPREFGDPEPLPPPDDEFTFPVNGAMHDPWSGNWDEHYVHHWFSEPWFSHSDPNDPYRHIGLGHPLIGTSWRNRPWFAGAFVGGVLMGDLIEDRVDASDTGFYGVRLGYDFDHYWGFEWRFAVAQPELSTIQGTPLNDHAQHYYSDLSLVCYPWGDSCWRPYVSGGVGFQTLHLHDEHGNIVRESPLALPIGVGVKTFCNPWFSLRFDLVNNIAIGNDRVSFQDNVSLMSGCEFRFGGRRTSFYPWHNNTTYW
jgi:hypothetical protein